MVTFPSPKLAIHSLSCNVSQHAKNDSYVNFTINTFRGGLYRGLGACGRLVDKAKFAVIVALGLLITCANVSLAYPPMPNEELWADAIYRAEGGASTRHPYGILQKYKSTSPRQACINTIRHKHADWVKAGSRGSFLDYLASKYAPLNVANDPSNLNQNWKRNVDHFLRTQS